MEWMQNRDIILDPGENGNINEISEKFRKNSRVKFLSPTTRPQTFLSAYHNCSDIWSSRCTHDWKGTNQASKPITDKDKFLPSLTIISGTS